MCCICLPFFTNHKKKNWINKICFQPIVSLQTRWLKKNRSKIKATPHQMTSSFSALSESNRCLWKEWRRLKDWWRRRWMQTPHGCHFSRKGLLTTTRRASGAPFRGAKAKKANKTSQSNLRRLQKWKARLSLKSSKLSLEMSSLVRTHEMHYPF